MRNLENAEEHKEEKISNPFIQRESPFKKMFLMFSNVFWTISCLPKIIWIIYQWAATCQGRCCTMRSTYLHKSCKRRGMILLSFYKGEHKRFSQTGYSSQSLWARSRIRNQIQI